MSAVHETPETEAAERDLSTLPLLRVETRQVHKPLSAERAQELADEIDQYYRRTSNTEADAKQYAKDAKDSVTGYREEQRRLNTQISRGVPVDVKCEVRLDEERGMRLFVELETGAVVHEERTERDKDREPHLPFGAASEGPAASSDAPPSRRHRQQAMLQIGAHSGGGSLAHRLHELGLLDPTSETLGSVTVPALDADGAEAAIADSNLQLDDAERDFAEFLEKNEDAWTQVDAWADGLEPLDLKERLTSTLPASEDLVEWITTIREHRARIDTAAALLATQQEDSPTESDE